MTATTAASPGTVHDESVVIDGLIIAKWDRDLFLDMRKGGLTAANCTVSVWEGFQETVNNILEVNELIADNSELVRPVRTTSDIRAAKAEGKTGIILGFQNAHAFEDQLGYISIFKQLGVGVVQLCYNTQNLVGTGCYERDGGLSGFGREVVHEMNRVGMLCDLSHVGAVTSKEVILESEKPVCYSHCLPYGLKEHPRNKTDEELRFIADHGGFVGVTMFAPFLAKDTDSTIEDYAEAIERCRKFILAGQIAISVGTILIVGLLFGLIRFDPMIMVGSLTAVIGGIVALGSNRSTSNQKIAAMQAAEAQRAELIGHIDLQVVGDESAAR